MTDTDRIVAAIFSAGLCQGKATKAQDYFVAYDECLEILSRREVDAKKAKSMTISDATLAASKKKPRR